MAINTARGQAAYNNPHWGVTGGAAVQKGQSSIGEQIRLDMFIKEALEEQAKERFFSQMSGTMNMPKQMGKTIKKNVYLPLLDDRNNNTQGIDAAGNIQAAAGKGNLYGSSKDVGTMTAKMPTLTEFGGRVNRVGFTRKVIESTFHKMGFFYEFTQEALDFDSDASLLRHMGKEAIKGADELTEDIMGMELLFAAGIRHYSGAATSMATISATTAGSESLISYKTLQRMALELKENRAPNRLKAITGTRIVDSKIIGSGYALYVGLPLENHFRDLEQFIAVEKYAAGASPMNGEIGVVGQFRIIVVPEMPEFLAEGAAATGDAQLAKFQHSTKAVTDYVADFSANVKTGGVIEDTTYNTWQGGVVPAATSWNGLAPSAKASAAATKWDVFPCLAVASEAFTVIGFQTGGAGAKFKMITKMPGMETADSTDPYGETGFTSIKWFHGMMVERPEWIAVAYTVAPV